MNTFSICQWGGRSIQVTNQNPRSLSNYIENMARFEGKLAWSHCIYKETDQSEDGQMSDKQIDILLSPIM
uniref:EF-hand domain-containing protein n=1 Tax=Strongyloides papillosus TaxID=174720 RepID=A0A0N5B4P7_STREA